MHTDYERIQQAIEFIRSNAHRQPRLSEVAEAVGLSAAYLQRLFRRWAGVSPKRFLQFLNTSEARRLLRDSQPVLDTALSIGLSGPGRLHDLIVSTDAVTPGEYALRGEGLTIRYGMHLSPFGQFLLGITPRGVCALRFTEQPDASVEIAELRAEWRGAALRHDQAGTAKVARSIFGKEDPNQLLLHLRGTNFQLKVWEALLRLPENSAISYNDLARRLGRERAPRAVASAVAANPVAYLIPCHRVLRSDGALGGYRWGMERKAIMLAREMAVAEAREPGGCTAQEELRPETCRKRT